MMVSPTLVILHQDGESYLDHTVGGAGHEAVSLQVETPHRAAVTHQRLHRPLRVCADVPNLEPIIQDQNYITTLKALNVWYYQ